MIPSKDNNYIKEKNLFLNLTNNENINENEIQNIFIQNEDKEKSIINNPSNKPNKQILKRTENIIPNNTISNNKNYTSIKTAIKPSKNLVENNIFKTVEKGKSNNSLFYSNEDKYSLLKMKKIKSNKFSPYKSTNHLYNVIENTFDEEKNDSKFLYFKMKKHKKIYSLRKAYMSHLYFKDEKNNSKEFKLFRDCDIGLNDGQKIKNQFEDFDVDSDEETKKIGNKRCIQNLESAIELAKNNNEEYIGKYMKFLKLN